MIPSFFTSSSYLYHCHFFLFSNIENSKCNLPQLEHPKGAKTHNVMWHPKVAKVNNNIQHLKATKSSNATMSVLCIFFFFFNFLVVNPTKHNNQQVFHLDFTSTLKIGQSQLPIFLVRQGYVIISNLSMFLLLCHLSSSIYSNFYPVYKKKLGKYHVF
jgi:hypothetical protein